MDGFHQAQLAAEAGDGLCVGEAAETVAVVVDDGRICGGFRTGDLIFERDGIRVFAADNQLQRAVFVDGDGAGSGAPCRVGTVFGFCRDDIVVFQSIRRLRRKGDRAFIGLAFDVCSGVCDRLDGLTVLFNQQLEPAGIGVDGKVKVLDPPAKGDGAAA